MNEPRPSPSRLAPGWSNWIGLTAFALALTFAMIRTPAPVNLEPETAYQAVLYETLRLAQPWGEALMTTDGPLAAVQSPGYVSGSIWMAMSWQIAGNLLLAAILGIAAWRLPWSRRWWAIGLLAIVLARLPTMAPWLAVVLLGWILIHHRERAPFSALVFGGVLGFLGLSSLGHLLLGLVAVGLTLVTARPRQVKIAAGVGFFVLVPAGWIALGQPLPALGVWVSDGFPLLWQTSSLLRAVAPAPPVGFWTVSAAVALIVALVLFVWRSESRPWTATIFLFTAAALAWKTIALQPFGLIPIFFATLAFSAFLLLQAGARPIAPVILTVLACSGLVSWQPLLLSDGIGHFNRQLVLGVQVPAALPQLRAVLHEQVKQLRPVCDLPLVRAAVGSGSVAVVGGTPGHAILNQLNLRTRPAPLSVLVRSPKVAEANRKIFEGELAPEFVLQRFQPPHDWLPSLEDPLTQLELYRRYECVLEEKGFFLWKKNPAVSEPLTLTKIAEGQLALGESLKLPRAEGNTAYWLELDLPRNFLGWLWSRVHQAPEPGLLVRDANGQKLHYTLTAAVASRGFLIAPFLRGEPDLLQVQSGLDLPQVDSVAVVPPRHGAWLRRNRISYRLFAVEGVKLAGNKPPANIAERYQLFSRTPIAMSYFLPVTVLPSELGIPIAFAHPVSALEFAVTASDQRVRAQFGILSGAYLGNNGPHGTDGTDGVDFSAELIRADGSRELLFHRHLDPMALLEDRGLQAFDIALPAKEGRLILRTDNRPGRGQAWDWSYWAGISIE